VEGVLEGHRVLTRGFCEHRIIKLLFTALSLVALVLGRQVDLREDALIRAMLQSVLELFGISYSLQFLVTFWVEVAKVTDELCPVGFSSTSVTEVSEAERVGNNLDGSAVTLELEEVIHNCGAGFVEAKHAELMEVLEPNLFNTELDLVETVVLHNLRDEVNVHLIVRVNAGRSGLLLKELAEILSYWQINKHILVEVHVIVTINGLDKFELLEPTQGIGELEQLLWRTPTLESFNHIHNIVDLVALEHFDEEGIQGVNRLPDNVGEFLKKPLFHGPSESLDLEHAAVHVCEKICAVVGVLEVQLEFGNVAD